MQINLQIAYAWGQQRSHSQLLVHKLSEETESFLFITAYFLEPCCECKIPHCYLSTYFFLLLFWEENQKASKL